MKCDVIREHLNALIDGELDGALAEAVTAHVASCEGCRREYAAYRDAAAMVRRYGPAIAPHGMAAGLRVQLEKERQLSRRRGFRPSVGWRWRRRSWWPCSVASISIYSGTSRAAACV